MTLLEQLLQTDPVVSHAIASKISEQEAIERERQKFVSDPGNIERVLSHLAHQSLPGKAGAKVALGSPLEKIEKYIPSDDPRKGLASKLLYDLPGIIEKNPGVHPGETIVTEYARRMADLNKDDRLYKHIRASQSSLFGAASGSAPGYEQWKAQQDLAKPQWEWTSPITSFLTGAGFSGAGILAGAAKEGMLGTAAKVAGRAIPRFLASVPPVGIPGIAAKVIGAGLMAIPAFAAFDIPSNVIRKSDWAQDRPVQATLAELALGGGAAIASDKLVTRAVTKYVSASKMFEKAGLDIMNDTSIPAMTNFFESHRGMFKAEDTLKQSILKGSEYWKNIGAGEGEIGHAIPRLDAEAKADFLAAISEGQPANIAMESTLSKHGARLAEDTATIDAVKTLENTEIAKKLRDTEFAKLFEERTKANPDRPQAVIADEINKELDFVREVFNPESAQITESAFPGIKFPTGPKVNPVGLRQELAKNQQEYEKLVNELKIGDYENPLNVRGMSDKDLVGRMLEVRRARDRGILDQTTYEMAMRPLEHEVKTARPKLAPKTKDISIFEVSGNKVASEDWISKAGDTLEGALNNPDPLAGANTWDRTIQHFFSNGESEVGAKTFSDMVTSKTTSQRYRQMMNAAKDNFIKDTSEIIYGSPEKTKGLIKKDLKAGLGPDQVFAKYGRLGWYAGVGAVASSLGLSLLSPDEAQAGSIRFDPRALRALQEASPGVSVKELMGKMAGEGIHTPVMAADGMGVVKGQKSLNFTPDIEDIAKKEIRSKFLTYFMTPYAKGQYLFKQWSNPQVILASKTTAALNNSNAYLDAVDKILTEYSIPNAGKEIRDAMKGLSDRYFVPMQELNMYRHQLDTVNSVLEGTYTDRFGNYTKLNRLSRRIGNSQELSEDELNLADHLFRKREEFLGKIESYSQDKKAFETEWETKVKELASKYPSTRVSLAVEGVGLTGENPWLSSMLTHEEKLAVGKIKAILQQHADRMVEAGEKPLTYREYIHHAVHPNASFNKAKQALEKISEDANTGIDLAHFHNRSFDSKQMMPDIHYIMRRYLPDANLRIEMADFWREWAPFMNKAGALGYSGVYDYLRDISKAFSPVDRWGGWDKWATRIQMLEVARLISLSPSVGFKHAMKVTANIAFGGFKNAAENLPPALSVWKDIVISDKIKSAPFNLRADLVKAHTNVKRLYTLSNDLMPYDIPNKAWDKVIEKWNNNTNFIINNVELFDRGFSTLSALSMAAKRGMTPAQASYLVYDTILKANFLSGVHNPTWLKDPKVRLLLLFQGTPYKIAEQRIVAAMRGGEAINDAKVELMRQLRADIKEGEQRFKFGLIKDALLSKRDLNGSSYAGQFLRTILTIGGVIATGKYFFDSNLVDQIMHLPFTKLNEQNIGLATNPVLGAAYSTMMRKDRPDDEFAVVEFLNKWMTNKGIPSSVVKAARLSKSDIPEIYKDSKLRYFFGVRGMEE